MKIEIDKKSGFCFGVVNAIKQAEQALEKHGKIFCLGDIVHNGAEVKRLEGNGLVTINHSDFYRLSNCTVLLRAHGEPPEVYEYARKNNITIIDATCPVVLRLQEKIKKAYIKEQKRNGQVVIFGTKGHAEVVGLLGQTQNAAHIINSEEDVLNIDTTKPISLFSQTTKNLSDFKKISLYLKNKTEVFESHDTICRQVSNREKDIREFSKKYDAIVFVSGKKSSNGKVLYTYCKEENEHSFFVSLVEELDLIDLSSFTSIGICGATSTPYWLMKEIADTISEKYM